MQEALTRSAQANNRYSSTADANSLGTLAQSGNAFGPQNGDINIFIMTVATFDLDGPAGGSASLTKPNNPSLYPDRINQIASLLTDANTGLFPGAGIDYFVYQRAMKNLLDHGGYGRAMVSPKPTQTMALAAKTVVCASLVQTRGTAWPQVVQSRTEC